MGASVTVFVTLWLQNNLFGFRLPNSTQFGLILSMAYFFLGGTLGGIVAKLVCSRAGIIDSIMIGTFLPGLLFWSSYQVSENLPLLIGFYFSIAGSSGAYAGTTVTKRFRSTAHGIPQGH